MFEVQIRESGVFVNNRGPFNLESLCYLVKAMQHLPTREVLIGLAGSKAPDWAAWAALVETAAQQLVTVEDRWTSKVEQGPPVVCIPGGEDMDPDAEVIHPKKITQGGRRAHVRRFLAELKARNYTRKEAISPMLKLNLRDCEPPLPTGELQGPLDATWPAPEGEGETKRGA